MSAEHGPGMTDADFQTRDLESAANDIANGVCPLCDEALNPLLPRWASSYTNPRYTAESAAKCVGPIHPDFPQYHKGCFEDSVR